MMNGNRPNILVLGGGFGGLEAAFYLRMKLQDRANITLVSGKDYFLFKPNTIYIPFGLDPEKLKVGLQRPTRRKNIDFVKDLVREADAAAEHLAARILGTGPEITFEPISMCVLEQFDKATFAQVPLRLTGVPEKPIEVDPAAIDAYKVGSYAAWRLGKKALGYYLPFRFALGNPFHSGVPWKGIEVGLKAMSSLMAK